MEWSTRGDQTVHFQHGPGADSVQVYLQYANPALNVQRIFNFSRKVTEDLDSFLGRVKTNLEKAVCKKQKKQKGAPEVAAEASLVIDLLENGKSLKELGNVATVTDLLDRVKASQTSRDEYSLLIMDQSYRIELNRPWVANLLLPTAILAGYYVYPNRIELLFCTRDDLEFKWYRCPEDGGTWEEAGQGFSYLVSNDDINHRLKLQCSAKPATAAGATESQLIFERVAPCLVQAGPGVCPFEERHLFTPIHLSGNQFRAITYNILADLYADSEFSSAILFSYCQKYALNMDYRKQLFIKEILGYHGDIICLQEVDAKVFDLDLVPILGENGFAGNFAEKREVGEGVAIFHKSDRFRCLREFKFDIGNSLNTLDLFADIKGNLVQNNQLYQRVLDRSNTLLVVVLRSIDNPTHVLVVANTHLYFHPDADHIRLLQAGLCLKYLDQVVMQEVRRSNLIEAEDKISILFAGDFNSDPKSGIYELMRTGKIDQNYKDWRSNLEEAITNVELSHPFRMDSATGSEISNYTKEFKECLDYIFYQMDHLSVERRIPMPSEEQLSAHTAIPSVVFPSDHVALIVDMKFVEGPR